ncbi:MAG: tetratricopeptide repeat protein, partial [Planctomycetota bacterium]|nr:tetratricopeptide repeat protein [Planctomycetota bacterium]
MRQNRKDHLFIAGVVCFVVVASLVAWRLCSNNGPRDIVPVEDVTVLTEPKPGYQAESRQDKRYIDMRDSAKAAKFMLDEDYIETSNPILAEAIRLRRDGKLAQAIDMLKAGLIQRPENAEVMTELGYVLTSAEKLDEAISVLSRAIELDPNNARLHCNLGVARSLSGDPLGAIESYRRAIGIKPTYTRALYNLGVIYLRTENLEAAEDYFRQATKWGGGETEAKAYFQLGFVLSQRNRIDDSIAAYRQAIMLKPDYIEARINLSLALDDSGDIDS